MIGMINSKYKTSMCRHFEQNGTCQLGARCHFAHGKEELRKITDPIPTVTQSNVQPIEQTKLMSSQTQMGGFQQPYPLVPSSNYKTVKCKYFEKGYCKYNESCSFAHGDTDIRMTSSKQDKGAPIQSMAYSQPTSQPYSSNPIMDPNIQNVIAQQQIMYLISQMEGYHSNNSQLMVIIKNAQELNNANNTQAAATLLYEIIQRPERSKEDADNYTNYLASIQQLGTQLYQQISAQFTTPTPSNDIYSYPGNMSYGGGMSSQSMGFSGGMGASGGYSGGQGMMMGGQQISGGQYSNGGVKGFSSK